MAIELSYGGEGLLFDKDGRIQRFLDDYQPLDNLCEQIRQTVEERHTRSISGNRQNVGLPHPEYPPAPPPRLNQLYWPSGATRWAQGFFLCGEAARFKIATAAYEGENKALPFVFKFGSDTFTADMWLLSPHPIACVNPGAGQERLWLLPLVDERYWWQFADAGDFNVTLDTTWITGGGGSLLETALGITIQADAVDARYLGPDPEELRRRYGSAAHLLEAASMSVGQRIVRGPDGTVRSQGWFNAKAALVLGITAYRPWAQIAGDAFATDPPPEQVRVVFPRQIDYVALLDKVWTAERDPPANTFDSLSPSVKTIRSTAYANYTFTAEAADPNNASELNDLADAIAEDYYASCERRYDYTFQGIKRWYFNSYDDHALYNFGGEALEKLQPIVSIEDGGAVHAVLDEWWARRVQTRIQSISSNTGDDQQLSQDPTRHVLGKFQFGKMYDAITDAGQTGLMDVWEGDPTVRTAATEAVHPDALQINVYSWFAKPIAAGEKVFAWWDVESERWYVVSADKQLIRFELTEPLVLSGSADALKLIWNGSAYVTTGTTITVNDFTEDPGAWQGDTGFQGLAIELTDRPGVYEIIWMETFAKFQEATAGEDMGYTTAGEIAVTVDYEFDGKALTDLTPIAIDRQELFKRMKGGAKLTTNYDPESDKLAIVNGQTQAGWLAVTLTTDMAGVPASASATIDHFAGTHNDVQDPDPPGTFTVYGLTDISDTLKDGDKVFAIYDSEANKYYCLAKPGTIMPAIAVENWTADAPPYVNCKLVPNFGSVIGDAIGAEFEVLLPRTMTGDPNVNEEAILGFAYASSGEAVCVTDYMDDAIGTVKQWLIDGTPPAGWAIMDGTANASGNGGSGIDARKRFLRAASPTDLTVGETGGEESAENPDYDHNHHMGCFVGFTADGLAASGTPEFYAVSGPGAGTGAAIIYDENGDTLSISGSSADLYTDRVNPLFLALSFIERLDNSL